MADKEIKPWHMHSRANDMQWLFKNTAFLEQHHPGRWVAIENGELKGIGDTLAAAREAALDAGANEPLLTAIRSKEYQGVFLIPSFRVLE